MRRMEIINHQVKRGIPRDYLALRDKNYMRSSAQLKDSHLRPFVHGAHPDRGHELRGFVQSVCLKDDVPYPEWGPKILVAHLMPPVEALAPNDELERPSAAVSRATWAHTLPKRPRRP
jgi:hypothetical protein